MLKATDFTVKISGIYGFGLYANRAFKKYSRILVFSGKKQYHYDEIIDDSYIDHHCIQIDDKTYLGSSGKVDDYVNHSCNPNCGIRLSKGEIELIAIRNIQSGEELTFDYSTCMDEDHWETVCECGFVSCRGFIQDFKKIPQEIRQKYLKLGIVLPFITIKYSS